MHWIRSQARKLSLLALFALAMQFGLSFGHVHAHAAPASAVSQSSSTTAPDSDHNHDAGKDICAICATVAMANALVDATPPLLPLPASFHTTRLTATFDAAVTQPRHAAFRSRAPPRS
ncbi:MAG: DUF2946 domain-containing protein [Afipia sp.]|nr:DUF2946 domain-containing protein [Afipia sp.]OJW64793.1 MAG: hypothetical protein BGO65_05925 [Afipia sp. 64-13]